MKKLDYESMKELFKLSMLPASSTLSMILGRKVLMTDPWVQSMASERAVEVIPSPSVAFATQFVKGSEQGRLLFIIPEDAARTLAGIVMGIDGMIQPLDEIMLGTLKEVISQSLESAKEAAEQFLGSEISQDLLGLRRLEHRNQIREWSRQIGVEDVLLVRWELSVQDSLEFCIYAVMPEEILTIAGIHREKKSADDEPEHYDVLEEVKEKRSIAVSEVQFPEFKVRENEAVAEAISDERTVLKEIPLGVTVEIGSVVCTVQEILNLEEEQVLMLDKQAGSPADIVVNGQLTAKGDVLVVGDQFATRITEIVNQKG